MALSENKKWLASTIVLTVTAAISAAAAFSVCIWRRKSKGLESRIRELEISMKASLKKSIAERQGRIRAQQALRKTLEQHGSDKSKPASFPMTPIATVQSCFSTRNGTPRQPLIVPLARACLVLDSGRAPAEALEGLADYSHCWILYIFHLNTDLEKLWKQPSKSKLKAKVRVPKLKGGKMGVLATRSPHRPCPIGLTVAKVEAVHGRVILLSGVDLVDGTYLMSNLIYHILTAFKEQRYRSGSATNTTCPMQGDSSLTTASVNFSPEFKTTLASCWVTAEKHSLYASPDEFQSLIRQVLSWDIRSVAQRKRPHHAHSKEEIHVNDNPSSVSEDDDDDAESDGVSNGNSNAAMDVTYHLILEGVKVSYRINSSSNVIVEKATLCEDVKNEGDRCNYMMWRDQVAC
ncbi:uncharacterized protein LOC131256824 isoform X2 [Magnolia sinica]|uniref:uncharacterized protein LOC131256824 isoform X2 n=1 Tax=Magnolia sinica TaxID=86752 RepID=UPI002659D038|nr:uncharacterized protein LOC131256824 isoform X2 [Magnolia sinica]